MIRNLIFCVFFNSVVFGLILTGTRNLYALDRVFETTSEGKLILVLDSAAVTITGSNSNEMKVHVSDSEATALLEIGESSGIIKIAQLNTKPEPAKEGLKDAHKAPLKVDISGGSIPIEVHVRDGSIFVQKWNRDVYAHIGKGKIFAKENSGFFNAHAIKGEILVNRQTGRVQIDTVQAVSTVKEVSGDVEVQSFLGDVLLEKNNGVLSATTNSGNLKIIGGQGTLNFDTIKGNVSAQNFDGRVEGSSGEGGVTVNAFKESDIVLKSNQGKVTVVTTPGSGVFLNLYTVEGDLLLPQYLKSNRMGAARSFRGRLKGDLQKGSVIVKSQSGVVTVR